MDRIIVLSIFTTSICGLCLSMGVSGECLGRQLACARQCASTRTCTQLSPALPERISNAIHRNKFGRRSVDECTWNARRRCS